MADAPPAPDGTTAQPAAKPPKPITRRESQRDRDRMQRDSISEVEETIKRIGSHRGIVGVLIANEDGIPLKSTLDDQTTLKYAAFITPLAHRAKTITKSHDAKVGLWTFHNWASTALESKGGNHSLQFTKITKHFIISEDELNLLRIRTRTNEIIVTSDRDFYLIVAQKTSFLD